MKKKEVCTSSWGNYCILMLYFCLAARHSWDNRANVLITVSICDLNVLNRGFRLGLTTIVTAIKISYFQLLWLVLFPMLNIPLTNLVWIGDSIRRPTFYCTDILINLTSLRRNCTSNKHWACYTHCNKIINTFLKNDSRILNKIVWENVSTPNGSWVVLINYSRTNWHTKILLPFEFLRQFASGSLHYFVQNSVNGSQLVKMKKIHSLHVPAIKFTGKKQFVSKVPIILIKLWFL